MTDFAILVLGSIQFACDESDESLPLRVKQAARYNTNCTQHDLAKFIPFRVCIDTDKGVEAAVNLMREDVLKWLTPTSTFLTPVLHGFSLEIKVSEYADGKLWRHYFNVADRDRTFTCPLIPKDPIPDAGDL